MPRTAIDLRKEQQGSLARQRVPYSFSLAVLTGAMDLLAGRRTTLGKVKFLELLAGVPYHAWERHLSARAAEGDRSTAAWAREARENENWHLALVEAKMRTDGMNDPWYLGPLTRIPALLSYRLASWLLARLNIRAAFLLNAEFEDHAERTYARFVADNPQWEQQPAANAPLQGDPALRTWADVFRRIALDERNHRNNSYAYAGRPEMIVRYEGMPARD